MKQACLLTRLFWGGFCYLLLAVMGVSANGPQVSVDPRMVLRDVNKFVSDPKTFNSKTCAMAFKGLASIVDRLQPLRMTPDYFRLDRSSARSPEIWMPEALKELWQIRQNLRKQWLTWTREEREQNLPFFRAGLRYVQGMSSYLLGYSATTLESSQSTQPHFLSGEGFDGFDPTADLIPGDILLSSGASVVSALIRRLPQHALSYSHAAVVAHDGHELVVVEAIIEPGKVVKVPLTEWLKQDRSTFAAYRPQRSDYAALAAGEALRLVGTPYDFSADESNLKINCIEVPRICYLRAEGLRVPEFKSSMTSNPRIRRALRLPELTSTPGDIEFTKGLDIVGEWRHPKKMADAHHADVVMDVLLKWDNEGYRVTSDWILKNDWVLDLGVRSALVARHLPWLGKRLLGDLFPTSIPHDALRMIMEYRRIYPEVDVRLSQREALHRQKTGFAMTFFEKEAALDQIKSELINEDKLAPTEQRP